LGLFFTLVNDRFIFNLKLLTSTLGGGLAPSRQTVGSLLRTPWLAKPAQKMILALLFA